MQSDPNIYIGLSRTAAEARLRGNGKVLARADTVLTRHAADINGGKEGQILTCGLGTSPVSASHIYDVSVNFGEAVQGEDQTLNHRGNARCTGELRFKLISTHTQLCVATASADRLPSPEGSRRVIGAGRVPSEGGEQNSCNSGGSEAGPWLF